MANSGSNRLAQQLWIGMFCAVGLAFGANGAQASEITHKKDFIEKVTDRKLAEGKSWVLIADDGTVRGKGPEGGVITGTWEWKGKYYCREIVIDGVALPHDCQTVTLNGDVVGFTHKKGEGITVNWIVE